MNIRMANHNDIATLIKGRFDYFTSENWELAVDQRNMIEAQLQQYYSKHLSIDFFAALVEEDNGNLASIAFLAISEKPANPFFPTGRMGTILNVHTYPEHRRRGYATCAMNLLIEEAKRQNLSYVELSASEDGKPLYNKLGFNEPKPSRFTEMKLSFV